MKIRRKYRRFPTWSAWLLLILIVLGTMVTAGILFAAEVTFSWDPNAEPDLAGYNLYRAPGVCTTPGAFAKVATFGKVITGVSTVTGDGDYCFVLTAIDTAENESVQSNKVGVTVNVNPPLAPANLRSVGVTP